MRHTLHLVILAASLPAAHAARPVFSHPRSITNPYLPLGSLKQDILESHPGERVLRTVLPGTRTFILNGKSFAAMTVEDRESMKGRTTEVTKDYFAQDDAGNVYYLGEEVDQYRNGKVVAHEGAWMLGKDTKTPGVLVPAHPKVGARWRSEDVPHGPVEYDMVVSTTAVVTAGGKTYRNCLKVKETTADGVEMKYYAPGVGVVQEGDGNDAVRLVRHTVKGRRSGAGPHR
ncbi:MAG TPA: hypothetical protein VGM37_15780 [Armatimonadota bacterium]|jgi:hypothetical protein